MNDDGDDDDDDDGDGDGEEDLDLKTPRKIWCVSYLPGSSFCAT